MINTLKNIIGCIILMVVLPTKHTLAEMVPETLSNLEVSISGKLALCNHSERGEIIISATGGSAPYTYQWSTGEDSAIISELNAGTYTVTVTDRLGAKVNRTIVIQAPFVLSTEIQHLQHASCEGINDGAVDLNIRGRQPFTIVWSHGLENVSQARGLDPGEYVVTVTDYYQCTNTLSFTIGTGRELKVSAEIKDILCDGELGTIDLKVEGGQAPYRYEWTNEAKGKALYDLEAGNYGVIITDDKGCSIRKSFEIRKYEAFTLELVAKEDPICGGSPSGQIEYRIKGGEAPFKIDWSDKLRLNELTRKDLTAGTYTVKVEDKNGCIAIESFEIVAPAPLKIKINSRLEVDCSSSETIGYAWVEITGGIGPYHISWDSGEEDRDEIIFYREGKIMASVRDRNGCTITQSAEVSYPNNASRLSPTEKIMVLGKDEFMVDQGIRFKGIIPDDAVSWEWDFGDGNYSHESDPVHTYLDSGEYVVTLTIVDLSGCKAVDYYSVIIEDNSHRLMIPNAFSPNGDGLNDYFIPKWKNIAAFEMLIYNTWGELLYATSGLESEGWNGYLQGRTASSGNYIYLIHYTTLKGEKLIKNGVFTLVK